MEVFTGTFNKDTTHRCSTCNIVLTGETEYKEHYKTEFHRYNLKRKSVNLPPATMQQFNTKKQTDSVKAGPPESKQCERCNKSFSSEATYQQHLKSRKHQQAAANTTPQLRSRASEVKDDHSQPCKSCLFCRNTSSTMAQNLKHMSQSHGFFIPQEQYCKDIQGLVSYLYQKVNVGFLCLLCQNKGTRDFADSEALRNHMRDKSHCFMKVDQGYEEYEKYYDFAKLFEEKLQEQQTYKRVLGIEEQHVEIQEEDGKGDGDWESDDASAEGGDQDSEEEEEVKEEKQPKQQAQVIEEVKQEKKKVKTSKYVFFRPTLTKNGQLLLPNGKILGHRKYRHLYKQYYRPYWIKPVLKQISGGNWEIANQIAKRNWQIELVKQTNQLYGFKNKIQTRKLRLKVQQNRLQYYFRVQNPK